MPRINVEILTVSNTKKFRPGQRIAMLNSSGGCFTARVKSVLDSTRVELRREHWWERLTSALRGLMNELWIRELER